MTNEELSDLILSIKLEIKDDFQAGITTTQYKLPEAALTEVVIDVLRAKFSCTIDGNAFTFVHPKPQK